MPRFVVLRHDSLGGTARGLHWDFMLEVGETLRTWALSDEPTGEAFACAAERLPDHRRLYLDYEGEVSGGRGTVSRWDAGDYQPLAEGGPSGPTVVVELRGARLRGTARLSQAEGDDQRWRFSFERAGVAASGLGCGPAAGDPSDSRGTV